MSQKAHFHGFMGGGIACQLWQCWWPESARDLIYLDIVCPIWPPSPISFLPVACLTPATSVLGDGERGGNRQPLGSDCPIAGHHSPGDALSPTLPGNQSHRQKAEESDEPRRARHFRVLWLSPTPCQNTKCRSFHDSPSDLSDERRRMGPYPMSQYFWCVTDGLNEQRISLLAVLQMSLPHCCFTTLALPKTK